MARKKLSKRAKWLIAGGVAFGGYFVVRTVMAKSKKPTVKKYGPDAAVTTAINELGADAGVVALTDLAYPLAYPDCPPKLDPDDPTHEECVNRWLALRDRVRKRVPSGGKGSSSEKVLAKKIKSWLDGLSGSQRSQLRSTIGAKLYDPIANGAASGNESQVMAGLLRMKSSVKGMSQLQALALYTQLQDILGPKLDEFADIVGIG